MPTILITPATSASNSADFTVAAGAQLNLGLYTAAGGNLGGDVTFAVTRKNPAGTYQTTGVVISGVLQNAVVTGAGVYRVEKPVTSALVGVYTD